MAKSRDQLEERIADWEQFLDPDELSARLLRASTFIAVYEMLMDTLIQHLQGFFATSWTSEGPEVSDSYRQKVLTLNKKESVACAKWFADLDAISEDDLELIRELADRRNRLVHELNKVIFDPKESLGTDQLWQLHALISKVDKWWILNVEIPTNPDIENHDDIDEDGVMSFQMMIIPLMIRCAEGDDSGLREVYEGFKAVAAEYLSSKAYDQ